MTGHLRSKQSSPDQLNWDFPFGFLPATSVGFFQDFDSPPRSGAGSFRKVERAELQGRGALEDVVKSAQDAAVPVLVD